MNASYTLETEPALGSRSDSAEFEFEAPANLRPVGSGGAKSGTAPLISRQRSGTPNLARSWSLLRSLSQPSATTRRELEFESDSEFESGLDSNEFESPSQLPKIQIQKSLPLPTYGPAPVGPLIVTITGRLTFRGSIQYGNPQTTIKLSPGEQKADFEAKVFQSVGQFSLSGSIEPGQASRIGIKFGTESIDLELSAGIDFTKLFRASVTAKNVVSRTYKFGAWTFEGKVVPTLDIYFTPRPGAVIAAARAISQAGRYVVAIGRGLFFAGELGVGTALGAAALGIGIAVGGIAWIGLSLYLIGKAHQDGRALALGFTFNSGYASMLARLTSGQAVFPDSPAGQRTYWSRLTYDWRGALEVYRPRWVENNDRNALGMISELGEIAALQDFALFIQVYGAKAWAGVSAQHRAKYHKETGFRRERYHQIMNRQLRDGKPVGIPLEPPK